MNVFRPIDFRSNDVEPKRGFSGKSAAVVSASRASDKNGFKRRKKENVWKSIFLFQAKKVRRLKVIKIQPYTFWPPFAKWDSLSLHSSRGGKLLTALVLEIKVGHLRKSKDFIKVTLMTAQCKKISKLMTSQILS